MVSPQTDNLEITTSDNYFFIRIKGKRQTNKDTDWTKTENSF